MTGPTLPKTEDTYSQFGEDQILAKLFNRLDPRTFWCFECGAHDGIWLSNTLLFRKHANWHAVLAECKFELFQEMEKHQLERDTCIFGMVDDIDFTLSRTDIPLYFDLMSLDVDGDDYWLWKDMETYRPMIVCIEYNPYTNQAGYDPDHPARRGKGQTSRQPTMELAESKGYALVEETYCNLIFVDKNVIS